MTNTPPAATDAPTTPSRARLRLALLLIALTQLTIVLDSTIVTVALPHMQDSLGLTNTSLQWVVISYTLVSGGLLLLGGRLGDIFGRRRALILGVALFAGASLLGGFATDGTWLIAARVVQGIGAAIMAPATLALIFDNFPEGALRARAMGVWAAMSAVGGAVGLVLGGLLTTYISWRWTLFVNVPIGVLILALAPVVLAKSPAIRERIDLAGAVTATLGIGALIYALSSSAPEGPGDTAHWTSPDVIVGFVAGIALLVAFVLIERRARNPLLPLRVLADRSRAVSYLVAACIGIASFGVLFFLTLIMQEAWGYSPIQAGLAYLPWVVSFGISATIAGRVLPRFGARWPLIIGGLIAAAGLFWLAQFTVDSTYAGSVLGPLILTPLGFGLMTVPLASLAMSGIRASDAGVASGVLNVGQQIGASVGIAGLGTIAWSTVAALIGDGEVTTEVYNRALAAGFDRGFLVTACVVLAVPVLAILLPRRVSGGDAPVPPVPTV